MTTKTKRKERTRKDVEKGKKRRGGKGKKTRQADNKWEGKRGGKAGIE